MATRPVALVTGASRRAGIGAAIALALAADGWDVATTFWRAYDARMPWHSAADDVDARMPWHSAADDVDARMPWYSAPDELGARSAADELDDLEHALQARGARAHAIEADLTDIAAPSHIFDATERSLGSVSALVLAHTESVNSSIADTSVESFDRHFAVNARATWLLVREFGARFQGASGSGRIVALTSDHTVGNLPYGASKGALDRIVLAAAYEFAALGVTANVINPGPTDTGWLTDELRAEVTARTPLRRIGLPQDCARLVAFLCSPAGGWINGQVLHSNGGFR